MTINHQLSIINGQQEGEAGKTSNISPSRRLYEAGGEHPTSNVELESMEQGAKSNERQPGARKENRDQ